MHTAVGEGFGSGAVASDPHLPDLTQIISAGEQLVMTPAISAVLQANPQCRLINQYGPAETHVVSSYTLPANDPAVTPPPIGRPVDNHRLYVTTPRLQPVAVGAAVVTVMVLAGITAVAWTVQAAWRALSAAVSASQPSRPKRFSKR